MQIKLLNLTLTNFKGIKSYHLDPQGADITIDGMNGTGKSTLFDAFTWLLFGKDSHGATKFWTKPRDAQGREIEGAEPIVEATLEIDSQQVQLRRELKENWVQHRGELERERKSDTTKLFIDDVPKKLTDYQAYIDGLIDEGLFKLLTVPGAFNQLKTAQQRDILMTLFPEVEDDEVIKSDDQLSGLKNVLDGKSVDDKRKEISYQRKEFKKQVDGIPARIDEAERAKQQPEATQDQLAEMQATYEQAIADLQTQINLAKSTDGDAQRQQAIADLKVKLTQTEASYNAGIELKLGDIRKRVNDQQQAVFTLKQNKQLLESNVARAKDLLVSAQSKHDSLLDQYHTEAKVVFDEADLNCPTCHQPLPEGQAEELRKEFNVKHSDKLSSLIAQGKASTSEIEKQQLDLDSNQTSLADISNDLLQAEKQLQSSQDELRHKQEQTPAFNQTESYKQQQASIAKLEQANESTGTEELANLKQQLTQQESGLQSVKNDLGKYEQIEIQDERIAQLKKDEAKYKAKAQELEGQDYLLQQFTRAKSGLIESKLNELFQVVKFHLFDTQKDGTVVDTVQTTVDGIDYGAGLNTGARMRAGLDIINALDRKHGVEAPIFIDNAEGLTEIFPTDAQQIRLKVTDDKYLKVEA